jgi:hypothetical protein
VSRHTWPDREQQSGAFFTVSPAIAVAVNAAAGELPAVTTGAVPAANVALRLPTVAEQDHHSLF